MPDNYNWDGETLSTCSYDRIGGGAGMCFPVVLVCSRLCTGMMQVMFRSFGSQRVRGVRVGRVCLLYNLGSNACIHACDSVRWADCRDCGICLMWTH